MHQSLSNINLQKLNINDLSNNENDLIEKIIFSENDINNKINVTNAFYYARNFTLYNHYKTLINFII